MTDTAMTPLIRTATGRAAAGWFTEAATASNQKQVETLADAAYKRLRLDIIRGHLKPGERLRIEKLKTDYEIGPTPVREALQKLTAESLVTTSGNRGFAVAPLSMQEFQDLNTARTCIEKEALRLAVSLGDNAWEARVVAAHYVLKKEDAALKKLSGAVPDSWEVANADFHLATVEACGSKWLLHIRSSLSDLCERYRRTSLFQNRDARDLETEHAEIAAAVLDRDADLACERIAAHFLQTAKEVSV
jgi:DNA-binding GntR family transcriptional regulator